MSPHRLSCASTQQHRQMAGMTHKSVIMMMLVLLSSSPSTSSISTSSAVRNASTRELLPCPWASRCRGDNIPPAIPIDLIHAAFWRTVCGLSYPTHTRSSSLHAAAPPSSSTSCVVQVLHSEANASCSSDHAASPGVWDNSVNAAVFPRTRQSSRPRDSGARPSTSYA
eukprot:3936609-Rhodomonas_salina.1